MIISSNKVGSIHYTLKDDQGDVIDSSKGNSPLEYLHGKGNLIPGMENALEGKKANDKFSITVAPEDAYGRRDEANGHVVPRGNFPTGETIKVGDRFHADTENGTRLARVIKVEEKNITVDFNHPLADKTLYFDIEVVFVREASADELTHGHVHGPSCQH